MAIYNICFGRQLGSGGHEIAKKVSEAFSLPFYDKELLQLTAEEGNFSQQVIEEIDEKPSSSLLYSIVTASSPIAAGTLGYNMPINDRLFVVQSGVIRKLACKESAVYLGRCADYVLAKEAGTISIFIYADNDFRISRISSRHECTEKAAADLIAKTDKKRASYYNFYTGGKWGDRSSYDLMIDSSLLGVDKTADVIISFIKEFMAKK